jgi:hypothetical protein
VQGCTCLWRILDSLLVLTSFTLSQALPFACPSCLPPEVVRLCSALGSDFRLADTILSPTSSSSLSHHHQHVRSDRVRPLEELRTPLASHLRHAPDHCCPRDRRPGVPGVEQEFIDPLWPCCGNVDSHCACLPSLEPALCALVRLLLGWHSCYTREYPPPLNVHLPRLGELTLTRTSTRSRKT